MKVRLDDDFGMDLAQIVGWVLLKGCGDCGTEERLVLYVSGQELVLTKKAVGSVAFELIHKALVDLFELDLLAEQGR